MTVGGRKMVKLPLGYWEEGTPVLDEVELRSMTGVEEDILSDDRLPMEKRLADVMSNCMDRIGDVRDKEKIRAILQKLSVEDQTSIMVGLRSVSVGKEYSYVVNCPGCETMIQFSVDLDSLAVRPSPAKGKGFVDIALPSGRTAKLKPLLIEDSTKLEAVRARGTDAVTSLAIWARLLELDGKPSPSMDDIRGMLYADRVHIRNMFDAMEGGVEDEYAVRCDKCGRVFNCHLDIARVEFFAPKNIQLTTPPLGALKNA